MSISEKLTRKEKKQLCDFIEKNYIEKSKIVEIWKNYSIPISKKVRKIPNNDAIIECLIEILKLVGIKEEK